MRSRIKRLIRRALPRVRPAGLILMYHQVAEPDVDPWGLRVSPGHLDAQLDVLRRSAEITTITDLASDRRRTRSPRIAITIDDGFGDTVEVAAPMMADHGTSATVFVASAGLEGNERCWWDVLAELLLRPGRVPPTLELTVGGHRHTWDLAGDHVYDAERARGHTSWRAEDDPPTERHVVFLDVWRLLVVQPPDRQQEAIRDLQAWAGTDGTPATHLLSADELDRLASFDQVTIGGHTVNHPDLRSLPAEQRSAEIAANRRHLQAATGQPVEHFAYPYGRHCPASAAAVARAGYRTAVTTHDAPVARTSDPYALPRLQVPDLDAHAFATWLTRAWQATGGS